VKFLHTFRIVEAKNHSESRDPVCEDCFHVPLCLRDFCTGQDHLYWSSVI